jgi:hypothetical protein
VTGAGHRVDDRTLAWVEIDVRLHVVIPPCSPDSAGGSGSPAGATQVDAASDHRHSLVVQSAELLVGVHLCARAVGPQHPPPRDAGAESRQGVSDMARTAAADGFSDIGVGHHATGWYLLDEVKHAFGEGSR